MKQLILIILLLYLAIWNLFSRKEENRNEPGRNLTAGVSVTGHSLPEFDRMHWHEL